MDGVDIADQYQSYLSTQLKIWRSWFFLFFWLIDHSIINAFILCHTEFENSQNTNLTDYYQFWIWLAGNLMIFGTTILGHKKLLNFSTHGIARYGNQNAAGKKNTQIFRSYVTDYYKFPQSHLLAYSLYQQSIITERRWQRCKFCLVLQKKKFFQDWETPISTTVKCIVCYNTLFYTDYFDAFHCPIKNAL